MPSPLPEYIVRGGEQILCQPFFVKDVESYCYVLQADATALQAMCDRYLNAPLRALSAGAPPWIYRPFSSFVMLSFSHLTQTHAENPPKAWVEEHEAILWFLAMAGREELGVFVADRLAWFTPYIFVDSPPAMITGEIVYGFPKEIAAVTLGADPGDPFSVDTTVVPHYGYDSEATMQRLLTLSRVEARPGTHPELHTLEETVKTALERLPREPHHLVIPDLAFLAGAIGDLLHGRMPVVALKQFRDVVDGSRACYQAIVEFDLTMQNIRSPRLDFDAWTLDIASYGSHPIVADFGFPSASVPTIVGSYMLYDLVLGAGRVVASNAGQLGQR